MNAPLPQSHGAARRTLLRAFHLLLLVALLCGCSRAGKLNRHLERGNEYFEAKKQHEAIVEYLNVLRLDPRNAQAIRNIGLARCELGEFGQAAPFLLQARQSDPNDMEVRLKLGALLVWSRQYDQAWAEAEAILTAEPGHLAATLLLSDAAQGESRSQQAMAYLEALRAEHEDRAEIHFAMGNLSARIGEYAEAESAYRRATERAPEEPDAWAALAQLQLATGRTNEAAASFQTALSHAAARPSIHLREAAFLHEIGKTEEARERLLEIRTNFPNFVAATYLLLELELRQGRLEACHSLLNELTPEVRRGLQVGMLEAQVHMASNELEKAIERLQQLDTDFPTSPLVSFRLGQALLQQGKPEPATEYLQKAISLAPELTQARLLLAEIRARAGHAQEALNLLEELPGDRTEEPGIKAFLATLHARAGRPNQALDLLSEVQRMSPTDPRYAFARAEILLQQGQREPAMAALEQTLQLQPDFLPALLTRISLQVADGRSSEALAEVERLLLDRPDQPELMLLKGTLHFERQEYEPAKQALERAAELQPENPGPVLMLGRIYAATGQMEQALEQAERALATNPNDHSSLMISAVLHESQQNYETAIARYSDLLERAPDFAPALNNLAYLLARQGGDLERAYTLARQARALRPLDPYMADTLGWILYLRGDTRGALGLLEEAAAALPYPEVLFHVGMARFASGREALAREALQTAAETTDAFPGQEVATRALRILKVDPTAEAGEETVALLNDVPATAPDAPMARFRLAQLESHRGRTDAAVVHYQELIRQLPEFAPAARELAELYLVPLQRPAAAVEWATRARDLAPDNPEYIALLAWAALQRGDAVWALSLAQDAATRAPDNPTIHYRLAWAQLMAGYPDQALGLLTQWKDQMPDEFTRRKAVTLLELLRLAQDPSSMSRSLETRLKDEPVVEFSALPARYALARLYESLGEAASAQAAYEQILAENEAFLPAIIALARYYARDPRQLDQAHALGQQARARLPNDAGVGVLFGQIQYLRGDYEQAARVLAQSLSETTGATAAHYQLGFALHHLGRADEAAPHLRRALDHAPESEHAPEAKRILAEAAPAGVLYPSP